MDTALPAMARGARERRAVRGRLLAHRLQDRGLVNCMNFKNRRHTYAGYTLVEMMIVVSVIGILAVMTIPAFSGYLKRTRLDGSRNELMVDMYFARSVAISQHRTIQILFDDNQYRIVDTTDGSVLRTRPAPDGMTFAASANPNFYAWGLADASDVTLGGPGPGYKNISLLPTGTVTHD
jgi:prepilin-type N-terminal cleavage/methylation domain-containing protein